MRPSESCAGRSAATDRASARGENSTSIFARTADLFDTAEAQIGFWPTPESLEGRFLARLLAGAEISSRDWLLAAHSMRLATEAYQLRGLGWRVNTRRETVPTADRGRTASVGYYSLDERQREAAAKSDAGQRFVAAVAAFEGRRCDERA